jgi:TolB-like protein
MKLHRIILALLLSLVIAPLLSAQEMDKELASIAKKLAEEIKEQGRKKVTVLDFTDLQGNDSELGKYVAEQLTINLVLEKQGFSVLDRANLRKILAEHKLTATGLVDPENAKKLGMFAGVDALVLGALIPKASKMSVTAKIITTDTAEIVGAARTDFEIDPVAEALLKKPAKPPEAATVGAEPAPAPPPPKPLADLDVKIESFKFRPGDNSYGYVRLTLVISNSSPTLTYGVAVEGGPYDSIKLSNDRGEDFTGTDLTGISFAFEQNDGTFNGRLTDIPRQSALTVIYDGDVRWNGRPGDYRPYRLRAMLIFGEEHQGRYSKLRKHTLVLDIK